MPHAALSILSGRDYADCASGQPPPAPPPHMQADLVVMKKHQRGKIATFFLGSASDYVTKHCKRQLLLLH